MTPAQTISFATLSNKILGQPAFSVTASSDSTLAVSFASSTPTICATSSTNGSTVTLQAVGTCSIVASQSGNANYAAATTVTQSFSVAADAAPSVSITAPTSGQSFNAPASVTFTANATSSDATITQVQYFNGGALIGTATQAPYSVTWGNVSIGSYSITAVATDNLGTSTTSAPLALTVNSSVIVNLTSPGAGQSFNGGSPIQLTATATDSQGTITQVSFFNGSNLLAIMTQAPYGVTVSDLPEGTNSLTAQATDNLGQTGTSQAVSITVVSSGGSGNGQVAYDIHTDQLNTPRMITDQSGNIVWQHDNDDPFGNDVPNQSPNGGSPFIFNLRFPGQYYDVETSTFYNYFRDYDPAIGRYIKSDPIGLVGGQFSTYAYVASEPLSNFDRFGLANQNFFNPKTDPALWNVAQQWNPSDVYSVAGHGETDGNGISTGRIVLPDGTTLDAAGFAKLVLVKDPNWRGQPIVIRGCALGQGGSKSFAAKLANITGVPVTAPNNIASWDYAYLPFGWGYVSEGLSFPFGGHNQTYKPFGAL